VILSRELSLEEIGEIRQRCPEMELEVFVHGALCIAYSGRCLLSGYFNHRDPNQGTCTNACRWQYDLQPATEDDCGDAARLDFDALAALRQPGGGTPEPRHPLADQVYLIEEAGRPGELMPILEDEHGTYIMNSRDLRAIRHIRRLTEMGIDSFKIEGRTKSHYYVARTAQIYREAIDDAVAGRDFDPRLLSRLDGLANRGYTEGFYQRHADKEYQNYLSGHSASAAQQFVGEIRHYDREKGLAEVLARNKFGVGDRLEIINPAGNRELQLEHMEDLHGKAMSEAPGGGYEVRIPLPPAQYENALIAKYL
ncbi:MAG TPA: U32 family peptidase, partial [Gammaproteobacteria bacterium]|nr:U32 family peptidase [Gammaproteobacteria bacterium]